jgi:N-acetylneuraminic acid mutarotase
MLSLSLCVSGASAAPLFSKLSGEMAVGRYTPAAALLPSGKVLVAGGYNPTGKSLKSAELFNPATGTFEKLSAELNVRREEAGFAALADGRVLITGGYNEGLKGLKSAELFNPAANAFENAAGEMAVERYGPAAALLPSGKVLVVGGVGAPGEYLRTAELFTSATGTFKAAPAEMSAGRYGPLAVTLPNGKVLIAGGYNGTNGYLTTAELFNPETNTFELLKGPTHEMAEGRFQPGAALLQNGRVLIVGGFNEAGKELKSAEQFNIETNTFERLSTELTEPREGSVAVTLPDGRVLIVGGKDEAAAGPFANKYLATAEEASFTQVATTTPASSVGVTTATLNGTVLIEATSSAYFQYGTTTAYGSSTARKAAGFAGLPQLISTAANGLSPATTYHFRIVAENAHGPSHGADQTFRTLPVSTPQVNPGVVRPRVLNVTQSHTVWRLGSALASFARRLLAIGTKFSFTLNQQAKVTFAFTQRVGGRRVNGRCAPQTQANRHKRACRRTVTRGTLSFAGHNGRNRVSFQGRLSRTRKLRTGSYTLAITATNAAGQRSSPSRLTFTIVR